METILQKKNIKNAIKIANQKLLDGDLVIFPTETVYGIGADATNNEAVKKIYEVKNRPVENPLICHFENLDKVIKEVEINSLTTKLAKAFWPGPLTLILKKKKNSKISSYVSNNNELIGCRIPNHPIAKEILKNINRPIAAPSANIASKLSSTNANHLDDKLKKNTFIIDGGHCDLGLESTVINVFSKQPKILRYGSITVEQIKLFVPNIESEVKNSTQLISPGQQYKHYAPNIPIRINVNKVLDGEVLLNFGLNNLVSKTFELNLSISGNLEEAAKKFFDYLHKLDNKKYKGIAVAPISNFGLGKTINDRLNRAASNKQ